MKKTKASFFRLFFMFTALLLISCAALVVIFDPFYHYHAPLKGLKAVLNEKEYQCVGSLRNFSYDAVLAGSSMIENNDNSRFDEAYDCTTVKAARSYGATADLVWLLNEAFETHDIRHVFYNIDPSALHGPVEVTFEETGCPMYLYDKNPFNDVSYLFNKDVLIKRIPYAVAQSLNPAYDEALSYNWAEGKDFSREGALSQYYRLPEKKEPVKKEANGEVLDINLSLLRELTGEHPETEFHFFFPAYSLLWWDMMDRNGELESTFYEIDRALQTILEAENAEVFLFLTDEETVRDLSNYMDTMHCRPEINDRMLDMMASGKYRVTKENRPELMSELRAVVSRMLSEDIPRLEAEDAFKYDQTTD